MMGADKIRELLENGKRTGRVSTKEINAVLEELNLDVDKLDKLYEQFENNNIELVDEPEDEVSKFATLTEESLDLFQNELTAEGVAIDDPVKVYLKEIGRVPLLSSDEEVQLATDIMKGNSAARLLRRAHVLPEIKPVSLSDYEPDPFDSDSDEYEEDELPGEWAAMLEEEPVEEDPEEEIELTEEREKELREDVSTGERAKKRLCEANLRLVVSIAKKYVGRGMQFLDLIQEGNLGLIKAVEKFDPTKGFKFSTYATWWIRQAITRAIADQARTIRIPVHMVETINKVKKVSSQLLHKNGHEPSAEEIAVDLQMPVDKVREIMRVAQEPVSLETPIGEEEDSRLGDFIPDEGTPVPAEAASHTLLKEQLAAVLESLTPREAKVLRLRFGLEDGRPRTLEEVGKEFNVTRERIRQIEAKALRKLRHPSRSKKLRDFLD